MSACLPLLLPLKYGMIGCLNDTDCDQTGLLSCNNGVSCNCPLISTIEMCDCTSNKTYWNGSSCQPLGNYGDTCLNSLSSYMCKTLSQGTLCSNSTGDFRCECTSQQYFDTITMSCKNGKPFNGTCITNTNCATFLALICTNGYCR